MGDLVSAKAWRTASGSTFALSGSRGFSAFASMRFLFRIVVQDRLGRKHGTRARIKADLPSLGGMGKPLMLRRIPLRIADYGYNNGLLAAAVLDRGLENT